MKPIHPFKLLLASTAIVALVAGYLDPAISQFLPHWPQAARADFSATPNTSEWGTDGGVNTVVMNASTVYVGGNFSTVERPVTGGVPLNTGTAQAANPRALFAGGIVIAAVPDGNGGWYVGGNFTSVNGVARNNFAHIDENGTLDTIFAPTFNNDVDVLLLDGTTLYVGGFFTEVEYPVPGGGGLTAIRGGLAAFNTTDTGVPTNFDPATNGSVVALALGGATLYAGGSFTSVNTTTAPAARNNIAAFNTGTSTATPFDPSTNLEVNALFLGGTILYAGGGFTSVNTTTVPVTRNRLAAFDTATPGTATSFNPDMNSNVFALVVDGTTLYAGGSFVSAHSSTVPVARHGIAAFDVTTVNTLTSFDPDVDVSVIALALNGTTLYAGGNFTAVNATTVPVARNRLAAFDIAGTGAPTSFDAGLNGTLVNVVAVSDTTLYIGGSFTGVNQVVRNNLFAIDRNTDLITSFDPDLNGSVLALALGGTTLYAGGSFTSVNDNAAPVTRNYIAAFNTGTSVATGFDADISVGIANTIRALLLSGTTLYAGGTFVTVNSSTTPATRNNLAAFNTGTSVATGFDPDVDNRVNALLLDGTTLYAGGNFASVNNNVTPATRNHLAAFDTGTSVATGFDPDTDNTAVFTLLLDGTTLYAGGNFASVNNNATPVTRNNLAAFDTGTSVATPFNPDIGDVVQALALDGTTLYVGGAFSGVNVNTVLVNRNRLAAFSTLGTGSPTSFDPDFDDDVNALALDSSVLYVGGVFVAVNNGTTPITRNGLAAFDVTGTATPAPGGGTNRNHEPPSPTPVPSPFVPLGIVINSSAASTGSRNVLIDLHAQVNPTFAGTVQVFLSNDPSFTTFIPFSYTFPETMVSSSVTANTWTSTVPWDLCFGAILSVGTAPCDIGDKIVYARFYVNAATPTSTTGLVPGAMPGVTPTPAPTPGTVSGSMSTPTPTPMFYLPI